MLKLMQVSNENVSVNLPESLDFVHDCCKRVSHNCVSDLV